ncbi:MAG: hypothetical protein M3314_11185, partial [Actinomycetota bacterium]|nr:hypothetical protein [Actinomycetota bacterium]
MKLRTLVAGAIVAGTLGMAGPAVSAPQNVTGTIGPLAVPNAPVEVCVNGDCQETPALSTVALQVTATADPAVGNLPTVTPGPCPGGQLGGVLTVNGGSSGATVSGAVTGTSPTGAPFSQVIPPLTVAPGGTGTVSACAAPGGTLPPLPEPTGLLGLILGLLEQLLGGLLPGSLPI